MSRPNSARFPKAILSRQSDEASALRANARLKFYSRSHDAVIRVYDEAGNVIETHDQAGEFKEP
jgi:hypothetical protein